MSFELSKKPDLCQSSGFTLVELAIVITIIGLLIGGVLKGQEMIQTARVNATIAQIKSYQAATETFRDRFDNLPGDFSRAVGRLPGCTAANFCYNGDGNGFIGLTNAGGTTMQTGVNTAPRVETAMYWKHMALADLISGVNPTSDPTSPVWGRTHPSAPFAGGFDLLYLRTNPSGGAVDRSAHWLRLQNQIAGTNVFVGNNTEAISPYYAAVIDRKMDDGLPISGNVFSDDQAGGYGPCESSTIGTQTAGYLETEKRRMCIMFFNVF